MAMAKRIIDKFNAGSLDIEVETAKKFVAVCAHFDQSGFKYKGAKCDKLHVTKDGKLRPSLGLEMAQQLHADPTAHLDIQIDPVLGLGCFLIT